jgi:hypothetical protein
MFAFRLMEAAKICAKTENTLTTLQALATFQSTASRGAFHFPRKCFSLARRVKYNRVSLSEVMQIALEKRLTDI